MCNRKKQLLGFIVVSFLFFNSILSASEWKVHGELYNAIKSDDTKTIESILEKHPALVNKQLKYHSYPVLDAAFCGSAKALRLLVEKGADIKKSAPVTGNSIVHAAVGNLKVQKNKREAVLAYLIEEKKLKIDITNKRGQTPFNYTFISSSTILPSIITGNRVIEVFDKYGANLNAQDAFGTTVLNHLSKSCQVHAKDPQKNSLRALDMAKFLMTRKSVDVNLPDKEKRTPLISFLVHTKRLPDNMKIDFLTALMENGAKTKLKSKKGEKPLKLVEKKSELYKIMKKKYKKK